MTVFFSCKSYYSFGPFRWIFLRLFPSRSISRDQVCTCFCHSPKVPPLEVYFDELVWLRFSSRPLSGVVWIQASHPHNAQLLLLRWDFYFLCSNKFRVFWFPSPPCSCKCLHSSDWDEPIALGWSWHHGGLLLDFPVVRSQALPLVPC